jgi:hypothetical protein
MTSRLFASLGLPLLLIMTGCPSDDEASLSRPNSSLAVGAYYPVVFGDACASHPGKMPTLCSTEGLTGLDSLVSDNPEVVRIVSGTYPGSTDAGSEFAYYGVAPGKATIRATGHFKDGSIRSDAVTVTVKAITAVKVKQDCNGDSSGTIHALPGESAGFVVYHLADQEELEGCIPGFLDSLPGLTQSCRGWWTDATWKAPESAFEKNLTSRTLSKPIGKLSTWSTTSITDIRIVDVNNPPYVLSKPDSFALYVRMSAGPTNLCKTPSTTLRSLTPEVCTGPQGETQWTRSTEAYVYVRGLREGHCRLQASLDGTKWSTIRDLSLFFWDEAANRSRDYAGFGNPCSTEGETTCSFGLSSVAICRNKQWAPAGECGDLKMCDFRQSNEAGCKAGTSCAACRELRPN